MARCGSIAFVQFLGLQHSDMTDEEQEKPVGVAALDRAFSILGAFRPGDTGVTLSELSRRTDLYKSTLLRLLASLERGGFVRKLEDSRYAIGPEPLRLAQIFKESLQVRPIIEPVLQKLTLESGETSSFFILQGKERIVIHRVEPARAVRVAVREGERLPIDRGASGKILQAFANPAKKEFEELRGQLWAVSVGERDPDTAAVSVPLLGPGDELIGALTLSGPKERMLADDAIYRDCLLLLHASARCSASLGGSPILFARAIDRLELSPTLVLA
jgi:DNA-binding IclR family transcriptional regulator